MVKIWEVDFTSFSGTQPQDNIGTQHLSSVVGAPPTLSTIGGLSNRPGVRFPLNNVLNRYDIVGSSAHNAKFENDYFPTSKRSFVMWCYKSDDSRDTSGEIWMDKNSFTRMNGFQILNDNSFRFRVGGLSRYTTATQSGSGWHMLAITVDRTISETNIYYQGEWVASGTYVPAASEGPFYGAGIGDFDSNTECNLDLGLCTTYDNVLSPASISGLYETFLIDSLAGEDPAFVISGTLYDPILTPISGAPIYLINVNDDEIYSKSVSASGGYYEIDIPFAGDYLLATTNFTVSSGARAVGLTASGVAGSGSITFHDGT